MYRLLFLLLVLAACAPASEPKESPEIEAMIQAEDDVGKAEALSLIHTHWQEARQHRAQIVDCARLAMLAEYNHGVIADAAHYIGQMGSNTGLFKDIAGIASSADHECPKLGEILELGVVCQSESGRIVEIAKAALLVDSEEERERLDAAIERQLEGATYASVEDALAAQH